MADCDGQHLGPLPGPVANENAVANEGAHVGAKRPPEGSQYQGNCPVARSNAVRHLARKNEGAHAGARAKQTVAPATRRAVLRRDHRRCVVPGCRNNEADNLITLCGVHHRAAHRGELFVEGSLSAGVRFKHADGSDYGQALEPRVVDIRAKAFAALRGLGFREGEIRRVLAESCKRGDAREANIERVVRDALAKLTTPRVHA